MGKLTTDTDVEKGRVVVEDVARTVAWTLTRRASGTAVLKGLLECKMADVKPGAR